jgi:putative SOS response-associated peptidase YedK
MCGRLGVSGNIVVPGTVMQFSGGKGKRVGIWGIPDYGKLVHNARLESLSRYWRRIRENRGILLVNSFIEPEGPIFGLKTRSIISLGVVYDDHNNFAIVTEDSYGPVKLVHHRMPIVVTNRDEWIMKGGLSNPPEDQIIVLGDAGRDTNTDK